MEESWVPPHCRQLGASIKTHLHHLNERLSLENLESRDGTPGELSHHVARGIVDGVRDSDNHGPQTGIGENPIPEGGISLDGRLGASFLLSHLHSSDDREGLQDVFLRPESGGAAKPTEESQARQ
ncbi:MAG: hypothetical protein ACE5JS_23300 [Nitrospinota bacterium]